MVGHTGAVRATAVFDSECRVASGSRDKTVKIWSVNHGETNEDALRRTYLGHRKAVFEVLHAPRTGHITSCDGSIHVWNPETGCVTSPPFVSCKQRRGFVNIAL
jgi:WD40 repeat protein